MGAASGVEARHLTLIMSLQMVGVFAEFERSTIQARVRAGLKRARAQGKTLGRPRVPEDKVAAMTALKCSGESVRRIAEVTRLGVGTVHRIKSGCSEDRAPGSAVGRKADMIR